VQGASVLVITHRTSVLPQADKLLMLRDGQVAMFGQRDEVLQALQKAQTDPNSSGQLSNTQQAQQAQQGQQAQQASTSSGPSSAPSSARQPIKTMTVAAMPVVSQKPKTEGNPS